MNYLSILALIVFLSSIYFERRSIMISYAKFLIIDNAQKDADAIIILSGNPMTRISRAIELYERGFSKRIMTTNTSSMVNYIEKYYMVKSEDLVNFTVVEKRLIEIIPSVKGEVTSTIDEAINVAIYVKKEQFKKVIIVTDAFHSRRSQFTFSKIFNKIAPNVIIEVAAASNDVYNENNWWKTDIGFRIYIIEGIKFLYYFVRFNIGTTFGS